MWKFPPEVSRIVRSDPLTDYRTILMTDPVTTGTTLTAAAGINSLTLANLNTDMGVTVTSRLAYYPVA